MAESRIDDVHEMEPLNPEALASRTSFDGEAELEKPDLASSNNNYMVGILMLLIVRRTLRQLETAIHPCEGHSLLDHIQFPRTGKPSHHRPLFANDARRI